MEMEKQIAAPQGVSIRCCRLSESTYDSGSNWNVQLVAYIATVQNGDVTIGHHSNDSNIPVHYSRGHAFLLTSFTPNPIRKGESHVLWTRKELPKFH